MLYPKNFEDKIGFDKIRLWLKDECCGTIGHEFVDRIRFNARYETVAKLLGQTQEFKRIIEAALPFPNTHFLDVKPSLQKASIEGAFLLEEEFYAIKLSFFTLLQCLEFLSKQDESRFPLLKELGKEIGVNKNLLKEIDRIIDETGHIKDNASPELRKIRSQIISEEQRLRKKIQEIVVNLRNSGILASDTQATIRDGRMVVPIGTEYKRRVRGFVHDTSASGQTIFVEPEEVLEINNEIRELGYEERREIVKILTELTSKLRPEIPALEKAYGFLGMIDFIRAKARFSIKIEAVLPKLDTKPVMKWTSARHPILYLNFKSQNRHVVPLDVRLNDKERILLISGPNAGGKSVCLKTVGLVQYMLQCGLLVPLDELSTVGIFETMCIDIGDEQSLENDLSTYSSHLKNMKHFLQYADSKSLVLIDEFGTGTDPQFGGTIAEAILEEINEKKAFGVITTHYTNLKTLAENTEGLVNGAMRYDVEHLEPLFLLEIGKPGSSFALEIARKIGLPKTVVQKAREKLGREKLDLEKLLKELEQEKKELYERNALLQKQQKETERKLKEYSELKETLEGKRQELIRNARQEAKKLLQDTNKLIENTVRGIKENQADKEQTKVLRKEIETFKESLETEPVEEAETLIEVVGGKIEVGDWVKLENSETFGEVVALRSKEASVVIGELRTNIKLSKLQKISRKEVKNLNRSATVRTNFDLTEKAINFSMDLDVRGMRGEEALQKLEQFIDNAIILQYQNLRIVHGKGDGILRTLLRDRLKQYRQVGSVTDEHADRGGAGVTLVALK